MLEVGLVQLWAVVEALGVGGCRGGMVRFNMVLHQDGILHAREHTYTHKHTHTQVHMRHIRALARTRTCVHPTYRFESVSAYVDWVAGGVQEQVNSILI